MSMNKLFKCVVLSVAVFLVACTDSGSSDGGGNGGNGGVGTAGSTSRMTIVGDYLYAISGSTVQLLDITAPESPSPWVQVPIDWDIQTLFPYENYLLVGAADGVHVLENSDQSSPYEVGRFEHARAIDPVVAQNGIAYVTIRRDTSRPVDGIEDQMNVIDLANPAQPALLETIAMRAPEGLAVDGEELYVCDGQDGLKVFDLLDPQKPVVSHIIHNVDCRDLIAQDDSLLVIDDRGLSQYDTSSAFPTLLSTIDSFPVVYVVDR